jgi:signal transduction histidine kinase
MMSNRSFSRRLTLTILVLLFVTNGSLIIINYQIERQILIDQLRQRALLMGKTLQLNLAELILKSEHSDLAAIPENERTEIREFIRHFGEEEVHLDTYSQNEGVHDLFFVDGNNRVTIDYPAQKEGRILPSEERIDAADIARLEHNEMLSQVRARGPDTILFLTFPVLRQQQILGFGRIEMSMNSAESLLNRIKFWSTVSATALFLIAVVLAAYFARSVTRPIGDLVQAAKRIGAGDLRARLDESSGDEIGVLKIAFNQMVEGIVRLEETQKRMEKSEIASQLAARMAHEIKNPLNSLGLIADHIGDRFAPQQEIDRTKFRELLENMKSELARLNQIVEGFLRFARPTVLSKKPTDISDLIGDALNLLQPEADRQGVRIQTKLATGAAKVSADYSQMRQALLNLIINALQAMPDGGQVEVLASADSPESVEVIIRDTGCGIAPEHLSKLFDPYFTTKVRGFGLGLSIVERIVQEHGGSIVVKSQPGKGASFIITLPTCMTSESTEVCAIS